MDGVVVTAGHRYEVAFDVVARRQVFVLGAVSDDSADDGALLSLPCVVAVDEPLLDASAHENGYALAGDPDVALADRSIPHPLRLELRAEGYRAFVQTVTVPASPVLPVISPVVLRRLPLRLTGRVTEASTGNAVAGAGIAIVGPALPNPARALLLSRPLAADLSAGAQMQGHTVTPIASPVPVKTARAAQPGGVREVVLDDLQGLVAGTLLRFGVAGRAHWAQVDLLPGAPGLVRLTAPLAFSVREADPAAPFTLGAPTGPVAAPIGAAFAGEGVVIADATLGGDLVAIADPPQPARFVSLGAVTGAAGDYAIDGLARLARVRLAVTAAGFTGQTRTLPLRDAGVGLTLDWRLSP